VSRRPMLSLQDPKLGVLAVSPAYRQVAAYFRQSGPYVTVRDNAFSLWSQPHFLYTMRNQKSICAVFEPCPVRGRRLIGPND
jgi:hypothetical protein